MTPDIEWRDVDYVFHGLDGAKTPALSKVSLTVRSGETLVLIGPSGSGKSTLLRLANRLLTPASGQVIVGSQDIAYADPIRLRRNMGYVVQSGGLFPHLTVADNIGLLCTIERWAAERRSARIEALLDLVNLPRDFGARYPRELSGGQRQRVGVARALALDPPIVLLDEPFGALDPITRGQLHEEFAVLRRSLRKTMVLVTHDMAEAFALGDRVAVLQDGRLLQVGTEEDLRLRPASAFVEDFLGQRYRSKGART